MKLNTPRWWYTRDRRHGAVARTLLKPAGWIWTAASAFCAWTVASNCAGGSWQMSQTPQRSAPASPK